MFDKLMLAGASAFAIFVTASSASATVVNFDDVVFANGGDTQFAGSSLTDNGFTFTDASDNGLAYVWEEDSPNSNGTNRIAIRHHQCRHELRG